MSEPDVWSVYVAPKYLRDEERRRLYVARVREWAASYGYTGRLRFRAGDQSFIGPMIMLDVHKADTR